MYRKCIDSRMASQHRPPLPPDKEIGSCSQNYGPCVKPRGTMDCHHFSSHSLSLFQAVEGRDFSLHAALGSLGKMEPPLALGTPQRGRCVAVAGTLCCPPCVCAPGARPGPFLFLLGASHSSLGRGAFHPFMFI